MFWLWLSISILIGYLLGSIPISLIISKRLFKFDIRNYGSKNMGGTNVGRVMGKKWGALVVVLDAVKTFIPVLVVSLLAKNIKNYEIIVYATGFASLLGHCYPIFAGFKGGKAVACTYGFILATNLALFFATALIFFLVLYIKKYVSLGSILSAFFAFVLSLFPPFTDIMNFTTYNLAYSFTLLMVFLFVLYRHRKNVIKILKHEENKVSWL